MDDDVLVRHAAPVNRGNYVVLEIGRRVAGDSREFHHKMVRETRKIAIASRSQKRTPGDNVDRGASGCGRDMGLVPNA